MNRIKRINKLYTFFKKDSNNKILTIIIKKTNTDFNKYIVPLVNEYCPEIKDTPFYLKLRLGSTSVYALGAYIMLFVSSKKYNKYRYFSKVLNLNEKYFLKVLNLISFPKETRKQIIYAATFNVIIDHLFDHELNNCSPSKRSKIIKSALKGTSNESNLVSLLSYLASKLNYKKIKYFEKWCDAEAKSITHKKSYRGFGVKASMDLLYSTINTSVPKKYINLMYDVGYLVQMIDDYIDLEDDLKQNKITPVIEKKWTYVTIINQYNKCSKSLSKIARENNISEKIILVIESNLMAIGYNLVNKMAKRDAD